MMSVGFMQILLIVLVVVLLFGSGRISKLLSELGRGVKSFKKGLSEDEPKKQLPKPEEKKTSKVSASQTKTTRKKTTAPKKPSTKTKK